MKIIEKLSDMIEEEIEGAEEYAKCAVKYKEENPTMASVFYNMSLDELKHVNMLHDEVVKLINKYRSENGEPPEGMSAIYNYLHDKHIDHVTRVKSLQNQYKEP